MTILITGGAWFIGSSLAQKLLTREWIEEIVIIDNLSTGNKNNIPKDEKIKFIEWDAGDTELIKDYDFDEIYHLASAASPKKYQIYAIETMIVNAEATRKLLDYCVRQLKEKKRKVKFLFASTSEIYWEPISHPQSETDLSRININWPRACYDVSKAYGDVLTRLYAEEKKIDTKIVRIFNTYWPALDKKDGRIICNFIEQAKKKEPFTIYGAWNQTRSFSYVDDTVDGILTVMEKGKSGEVYNVGNPFQEFTVESVARIICKIFRNEYSVIRRDLPQDDPSKRKPSINKIQSLDWNPKVNIYTGIKKMIGEELLSEIESFTK